MYSEINLLYTIMYHHFGKGNSNICMTERNEVIYKSIKQAILEHRLPPNTQLVEDALAESFGVSRTLVRQVLRRLSYEKLVKIIPNKGAFVACPTIEEAKQIFEIREVLEAAATRQACKNASKEELDQIEALIMQERNANLEDDAYESLRLSLNFHLKIAELTRNSYYQRYLEELTSLIYVIVSFYGAKKTFCGCDEHQELLSLIKEGKEDLAEKFMIGHLREVNKGINFNETFSHSLYDIFKKE